MNGNLRALGVTLLLATGASVAAATDVPVTGLKLIIVDKTSSASSAKAVFVAKDAAITKGAATDPADLFAELDVAYDASSGMFTMPPGPSWIVNKSTVAKFVNNGAPSGSAVKVSVIKPGALIKVVAKSLGDTPIDISSPPTGSVYVVHSVLNGDTGVRHCTRFDLCSHKVIAGGTGYKLVCKGSGSGDPTCLGAPPPVCCNISLPALLCGWAPSAFACSSAGGTPGADGSTCDSSTGTCMLTPTAGPCCEGFSTFFGTLCLAGPALELASCPSGFSGSALCQPDGSCL